MGLRAVDQIAERHGFEGVYGPLYRLFEVTDAKFSTAVELTAGNRQVSLGSRRSRADLWQFVPHRCR